MQSLTSKIFMNILRFIFHSPLFDSSKLSDNASKLVKDKKSHYRPSKDFVFSRVKCGNAFYERIEYQNKKSNKIILYIHGGGFKAPLIDTYRRLAEKYSRMFGGATLINADYRLYPQYELPAQMFDIAGIYLQLLNDGVNADDVIVMGDSAGANLALTSCLWLRDNGYPLPSHIVCFSLWGDATSSGSSRIKNAYSDPFYGIPRKAKIEDNLNLLRRISKYVQNLDRTNPYISPCFASFEGFKKVTLICGTAELDESDNDRVYEKMNNIGVDVELHKFDGMCHDFQLFSFLPESKKASGIVKNRIEDDCDENS